MEKHTEILENLKERIFAKQTVLAEIFERSGGLSVYDYSNSWKTTGGAVDTKALDIIERLVGQLYGPATARGVVQQLSAEPLVSTIDHHGILNHPFFVNSNLIYSLRKNLKYLVCFSTAGISLNNSSWPGCLLVREDGLKRFSLFPDRMKTRALLGMPAFSRSDLSRFEQKIASGLNGKVKHELAALVADVFGDEQVLGAGDFSAQASLISTRLWAKYFPGLPELIYLPVEDVVGELLLNLINTNPSHPLYQLFYTKEGWTLLEKHFDGWLGAFTHGRKGSFLFWAIGRKGRRVHLRQDGTELLGEGVRFNLGPETVASMLEQRQIYPTSLTCFLVMLWYGLTALGGFNQVNWLTDIKEKFAALLKEAGQGEKAASVALMETANFAESNLAFLALSGSAVKATGTDFVVHSRPDWPLKYERFARQITVRESLLSLMPEIYRIVIPADERKSELLALTDEQAAEALGLAEKIKETLVI